MTADNVLFEIKGLKKNFGDLEVLKGIHTTIRKGEVVVVIGPSGSGKSTFIRWGYLAFHRRGFFIRHYPAGSRLAET